MFALVAVVFVMGHWLDSFGDSSTGILVPLYVFPANDTSWQPLIDVKTRHQDVPIIAVINPFNGPGTVLETHHSEQIPRLHAVGIKTIGYVATVWTNKTIDDAKLEIDLWKQMYPDIEGIFFDQMSNLPGNESYYSELDAYAKSKDGFDFTVGNAGVDTIPSYVGTVDNITIHENVHFPSLEHLDGWHTFYDKGNFSFLVHTYPQLNASQIVSASNHVSYLYVTDDELAPPAGDHDPWGTISSHIELLAESLDSPSVAIQIDSRDLVGNPIEASNLVISSNDVVVRTGPSPLSYDAISAITYAVSAVDFGNFTFAHWENFDTNQTRTITPLQGISLIAFYNAAPTAVDDSKITQEDTPITISVLENDSDVDGDMLSVSSVSIPSNGTATINADNTITYMPNLDFSGTDSFTYIISDGDGATDTTSVSVTITPVNDPPLANAGPDQTVGEGTAVTLNGTSSTDPDNASLSFSWVQVIGPTMLLTGADTATPVFTAPETFSSVFLTFQLTVSDGILASTDTVDITVNVIEDKLVCGKPMTSYSIIIGTDGDDRLKGSASADLIVGLGGNDQIRGKQGNDCLIGGDGNDKIWGGKDDDTLDGGTGNDMCTGGSGSNTIINCEETKMKDERDEADDDDRERDSKERDDDREPE